MEHYDRTLLQTMHPGAMNATAENEAATVRFDAHWLSILAAFLLLLVLSVGPAFAQDIESVKEQKVVPSDPSAGARFGSAVAMDSMFAVVGSSHDSVNGINAGSAYIYLLADSTWSQIQKISANDATAADFFGSSVAISRGVVAVGSPGDEGERGGVYLFRESAGVFSLSQKISADDGAMEDRFGDSVSMHDDLLVVGSAGDDDAGNASGAAYVFRYNGTLWIQEAKLVAPDAATRDLFGISVGVSTSSYGDLIVVGASREDSSGTDAGAVYAFRYDGASWLFEQKLVADDGEPYDLLGTAAATAEDIVIGGAYGDDSKGQNAGSAYIWKFDGLAWAQEARLVASDAGLDDHFGFAVAISDTLAVVGSHWDGPEGHFANGSAYVFRDEIIGWTQIHKLTASDGDDLDLFGDAVAVSSYTVLAGAPRDDDTATDSGSAYFYALPRPDTAPPVAIERAGNELPDAFRIVSLYPNPFRDRLNIEIELAQPGPIDLAVYNIAGQEVARIDGGFARAGVSTLTWNAEEMASGIYLVRLHAQRNAVVSKVILLR